MNMLVKKFIYIIIGFYVVLFLSSTSVLLFEFVIPHGGTTVYEPVVLPLIIDDRDYIETKDPDPLVLEDLVYPTEVPEILLNGTIIGTYYTDDVLITIYHIRAFDSDVYVADVVVRDAKTILAAFAFDIFGGKNYVQAVSTMAEHNDAIFAINSDYASHYDSGYVIRNGVAYRTSASYRDAIVLNYDGSVNIYTEEEISIETIIDNGAWQLWSFGPVIIDNSISVASVNDGLGRSAVDNPRSAFGTVGTNHFMFVSVDGRTEVSKGVDIEELAAIMMDLDCTYAYNFDGGGSATMWFDGEVINHPSEGTERKVGDCVFIRK
jgi:hypothetical protein